MNHRDVTAGRDTDYKNVTANNFGKNKDKSD